MRLTPDNPACRVCLRRDHFCDLPHYALPAGFTFRAHAPGDAVRWFRIQAAADRWNPISSTTFRADFGQDEAALAARQVFVLDPQGAAVGTVTAWWGELSPGDTWGRVHWLAVLPEFQGRGLGRALMTWVCTRLQTLGHTRAYLTTSLLRLPALRLYLRFGFRPHVRSPEEAAAWREAVRQYQLPLELPD